MAVDLCSCHGRGLDSIGNSPTERRGLSGFCRVCPDCWLVHSKDREAEEEKISRAVPSRVAVLVCHSRRAHSCWWSFICSEQPYRVKLSASEGSALAR